MRKRLQVRPLTWTRQVYLLWFGLVVGINVVVAVWWKGHNERLCRVACQSQYDLEGFQVVYKDNMLETMCFCRGSDKQLFEAEW